MLRRRFHRLATSFLVVLSLLFSQLALANYVCPPAAAAGESVAMEMAPGEPCEGAGGLSVDQGQSVLCHQHCVDAAQSFEPLKLPTASAPAVVQVLVVPLVMDAGAAESVSFAKVGADRPPPDPLFLSTRRLRV
jgi:hypothetical protein